MEEMIALLHRSKEIHQDNVNKGFYDPAPDHDTHMMLIASELFEAFEAIRKNHWTEVKLEDYDKYIADRSNGQVAFEDETEAIRNFYPMYIKDTVEGEIAGFMIRLLDYLGYKGIDESFINRVKYFTAAENRLQLEYEISKLSDVKILKDLSDGCLTELGSLESVLTHDISTTFVIVNVLCQRHDINLTKHIDLELAYNKTRSFKHGKKF